MSQIKPITTASICLLLIFASLSAIATTSATTGRITGNEEITVTVSDTLYRNDDIFTASITLTGLDTNSDYEVNWKICRNGGGILSQASGHGDGTVHNNTMNNCQSIQYNDMHVAYDAETDTQTDLAQSSLFFGETTLNSGVASDSFTITIDPSYTTDLHPEWLDYQGILFVCDNGNQISWTAVNNAVTDCADSSDEGFDWNDWPSETRSLFDGLYNSWDSNIVVAELSVVGFDLVDDNSITFSFGNWGSLDIQGTNLDGVLSGMDYEVDIRAEDLKPHIYPMLDYDLNWEVTDANDNVIDSGTHSQIDSRNPGSSSIGWETVTLSNLAIGTYLFNLTLALEGEEFNHLNHEFEIIDPNAIEDGSQIEVDAVANSDGVGEIEIIVEEMTEGQHYTVVYEAWMSGAFGPAVTGEYTIIAPPIEDIQTFTFPNLPDGSYCFDVILMLEEWEQDSDVDCWNQASTVDTDNDGIRDVDDACPNEDITGFADVDNDGCIDITDPDGDGWSDADELLCGTDPNLATSVPIDTDGDGDCNAIDVDDDGDGFTDVEEDLAQTDSLDDQSFPNTPPSCDIYYSLESAGIVVVNNNLMISAITPGTTALPSSITITLPEGSYYLIAKCSDPDGDPVTATINGNTIGPFSEVVAGAAINLVSGVTESVPVLLTFDDGNTVLAAQVIVNLDSTSAGTPPSVVDDTTGTAIPGFTGIVGLLALLGAATIVRKRE